MGRATLVTMPDSGDSGSDPAKRAMAKVALVRSSGQGSARTSSASRGAASSGPTAKELQAAHLEPGSMVGEYRVEHKIGEGGMGTVYAAVHPVIGKKAAVKVMTRALCVDAASVDRFVREARAANEIGHPNIVDVFAFGKLDDGRSFLLMEWLQGESLRARMDRRDLAPGEAVEILLQVCDALEAAHDKNIIHRDLKPDNVFLVTMRGKRLNVKLLDFGIAKLLGGPSAQSLTQSGGWIGTPLYMSPEQARAQPVDYRTDVYALGATAYEMFLGRVPFMAEASVDVIRMHLSDPPPRPSTLWSEVPPALELLLLQMLEKSPENRPTMQQVTARLQEMRGMFGAMGPITYDGVTGSRSLPEVAAAATAAARKSSGKSGARKSSGKSGAGKSRVRWPFLAGAATATLIGAVGMMLARGPSPAATLNPATKTRTVRPPKLAPARRLDAPAPATGTATAPAVVAQASVHIAVNVPARIDIDGKTVADPAAAATISVEPGAHVVTVSAAHRRPYTETVSAGAGARVDVNVTLDRVATRSSSSSSSGASRKRDDMLDPFAK
jgi:eukaryotic-like serine/threonine-protein kinase